MGTATAYAEESGVAVVGVDPCSFSTTQGSTQVVDAGLKANLLQKQGSCLAQDQHDVQSTHPNAECWAYLLLTPLDNESLPLPEDLEPADLERLRDLLRIIFPFASPSAFSSASATAACHIRALSNHLNVGYL